MYCKCQYCKRIKLFLKEANDFLGEVKFDLRCWENTRVDKYISKLSVVFPVLGLMRSKNFDFFKLFIDWFGKVNSELLTKLVTLHPKLF